MIKEYYITAIRLRKKGRIEYISKVIVRPVVNGIVKRTPLTFDSDFVISLMGKATFVTANWNKYTRQWVPDSRVSFIEDHDGVFLITDPAEKNANSLYELRSF